MCWSGEASAVLAGFGFCSVAYLIKKKESNELWIPLFYFTLMELLQAVTYIYINQCNTFQNQLLTLLGYFHIAFQPFFINMGGMYFIPSYVKNKIYPYVYSLCSITTLLFLLKSYPFTELRLCTVGIEPFCGPIACSLSGEWHIAWQLPLNNLLSTPLYLHSHLAGLHSYAYMSTAFLLPILYGSWRLALLTFLLGPLLASLTTHNTNELPAIWCLFSIALCLVVIKSPIRTFLYNSKWFFLFLF